MTAKNALIISSIGLVLWLFSACQTKETPPIVTLEKTPNVHKQMEANDPREGPHNFFELHHLLRTRLGDKGPRYGVNYKERAYQRAMARRGIENRGNTVLPWIERGPGNVGGRTRGLWVDPRDASHKTWITGTAGGGLWKTSDAGETWTVISDDFSNLGVTTIAGSAADPLVLYAGTGEGFNSRMVKGSGIWKSIDGGDTWNLLNATTSASEFANVMRIVVDPEDPDVALVATRVDLRIDVPEDSPQVVSHLLKTIDGGENWEVVYQTEDTEAGVFGPAIQHIVADPSDFNILYASIRSTGIIRSIDRGETWEQVFEAEGIGRMELAVSPSYPDYVYFAAESDTGSSLYLSLDGGDNWKEVRGSFGNWLSGQGWYDNTIAVHPFDSNNVFVAGAGPMLNISVNIDTSAFSDSHGGSFFPVTDGYSQYRNSFPEARTKGVHVDHHQILLIPIDEESEEFYLLNANDGGVAFSEDGGETFTQTGDTFKEEFTGFGQSSIVYPTQKGYNSSQFYGVDKMNGADRYIGGTQDNGSWLSLENPDSLSEWLSAPSGDGFEAAWHYQEPNKILESSQFNNVYRSLNGGESWQPLNLPGSGPFITRLANSKQDPDLVFAISDLGVLRSDDFGGSWEVIQMPSEWAFRRSGNPIEVSLANPNVIWTANELSEDQRMVLSTDGGFSFSPTNEYSLATLGAVSGIATHPTHKNTAFALFSMADGPKVLKTTDLGQNWEDISGFVENIDESTNGFPDVAVYSLLVMPFDTNQLWAGTEIGLFESLDGGANWAYADNGLPPVGIWEMKIVNDEVVLATHGRGIWSVALPELEGYEPIEALLGPKLQVNSEGFDGLVLGETQLRSAYDSTVIQITAVVGDGLILEDRQVLGPNADPATESFEFNLNIPNDTIVRGKVEVFSYLDGEFLKSSTETFLYDVDEDLISNYENDFDQGQSDFARLGFNTYIEAGFDNAALHSPHPYPGQNQEFIAVFQKPILIDPNVSILSFDEIVLVEPGDTDDFTSIFFYDFVTVEGTTDQGQNWVTIEGYDSRYDPLWLQAYQQNRSGSPDLILNHAINLLEHFNPGEEVYLRFRLVSDPFVEGWGWMIDNLRLQSEPTTNTREEVEEVFSIRNFPNPFQGATMLEYTLLERSPVQINLFNSNGQLLQALLQENQPAGMHTYQVNTSQLPAGIYYCRFQAGEQLRTLKWIKQ